MKYTAFLIYTFLFVNILFSQDSIKKLINYYNKDQISSIGYMKDNVHMDIGLIIILMVILDQKANL